MATLKPRPHNTYTGTVLFLVIPDIKTIDFRLAYDCIVRLNTIAASSALVKGVGTIWTGSTISGLFIFIPDKTATAPHAHIGEIFDECSKIGLVVRGGISWGRVVCFSDTDNQVNFIGRAINTAARLAYSKDNPGCLIDSTYSDYAKGLARTAADRLLSDSPTIVVKGKLHDVTDFTCRSLNRDFLKLADAMRPTTVHRCESELKTISALVLAYDLPKFSAGDDSELYKRVRSMVDALKSLKANSSALKKRLYFCPGGDGGILVIEGSVSEAHTVAPSLARKLIVESEHKDEHVSVKARIGVHYGALSLYLDAHGRERPTGKTCFIADDLTSDSKSDHSVKVVYSDIARLGIDEGSSEYLSQHFVELPPLPTGAAKGLKRFSPKPTNPNTLENPLHRSLFSPGSSWQPEKHP